MDYILNKINQRIDVLRCTDGHASIKVHMQSRIEYLLVLMLGYLWNKNFEKLPIIEKERVFENLINPSIGTIVSICRTLDTDAEFFAKGHLAKIIDSYPSLRNTMLGHGFVYEDEGIDMEVSLDDLYGELVSSSNVLFGGNVDIVQVMKVENDIAKGIRYSSGKLDIGPWTCPLAIYDFTVQSIYLLIDGSYFCVSPFLYIENGGDGIYIYNRIKEKLLGSIHYNRLMSTGSKDVMWPPFLNMSVDCDGYRIRSLNGTIRNTYVNNFKNYIAVGIERQIIKFLDNNKASVCATLWGHGGIGKTATIQYVCDYYANKEFKTFDYIMFLSAKDRRYNYYKGVIEPLQREIATYDDIIRTINKLVSDNEILDEAPILNISGKMLLVIDDFESFAKEEAKKISEFLLRLDINHHKVIVTTRAANVSIGIEIKTNELDEIGTMDFFKSLVNNEEILLSKKDLSLIEKNDIKTKLYEITGGRPLFITQLVFIVAQLGLERALKENIKKGDSAIQFLYGRLYEYLSPKAKDLFVVLGLLVTKEDMINVIDKARYILNMENDEDAFSSALDELKKLKIVKISDEEDSYFEVYSKEILEIMNKQFAQRDSSFIGSCNQRKNQVDKDKSADIELSLLNNANANRLAKSELEIVESYKQLLNRPTSSLEIKLTAVTNLTSYLILDCGKREDALEYFEKYSHFFTDINKNSPCRFLYATYVMRWANTNWGAGNQQQKTKAITVLSDYFKDGIDYSLECDLELVGMLLMFKSLMVLSDWRESKDKLQFQELSLPEFKVLRKAQKNECKNVYTHIGNPLFRRVSRIKLMQLKSGTRQSLMTALGSYVELLVRLKKLEDATEVCDYAIHFGPTSFVKKFEAKKNWILSMRDYNK